MLRRRRAVQATAVISPRAFAAHLTASLDSPFLARAARIPGLGAALAVFWRLVRAALP
jgi:hypothetical protein